MRRYQDFLSDIISAKDAKAPVAKLKKHCILGTLIYSRNSLNRYLELRGALQTTSGKPVRNSGGHSF
jgi:hypothetical protein